MLFETFWIIHMYNFDNDNDKNNTIFYFCDIYNHITLV